MEIQIACIVEGHGDREALPIIIRRIAETLDPTVLVKIPSPIRIAKNKLIKPGELERAINLAVRQVGSTGAILILLDSDEDCPAQLGPELLRRALQAHGDISLAVVIAKREFEAWFLAAAESLRGFRGLVADLQAPPDPEAINGAKEWLRDRMESGQKYAETLDQPAFATRFDFEVARRADSFDKCYREIVRLITELQQASQPSHKTTNTDS